MSRHPTLSYHIISHVIEATLSTFKTSLVFQVPILLSISLDSLSPQGHTSRRAFDPRHRTSQYLTSSLLHPSASGTSPFGSDLVNDLVYAVAAVSFVHPRCAPCMGLERWGHSVEVFTQSRLLTVIHYFCLTELNMGKVHGSLARAGKVKSQTPKVEKQEKKKVPRGRAKKRILYNRR